MSNLEMEAKGLNHAADLIERIGDGFRAEIYVNAIRLLADSIENVKCQFCGHGIFKSKYCCKCGARKSETE